MYSTLKINDHLYDFPALEQAIESGILFGSGTEWERDLISFLKEWTDEKEYVTGKTSGSTGNPKTIHLSKRAMIASALRTNQFFRLQKGDNVLLCLSANYIAGKMMIVRAIAGGFNLITASPSSTPKWEGAVAFAAMVPLQVQALLATEEGKKRLDSIDKLLIGGGPVTDSLEKRVCELSVNAYLSYGMTETVSHVALCRIEKERAKEKVYTALPDVAFSTDDRGCLVIEAPYLQDEPFVTNDVVKLFSETSFSWLGRWDNVINSGGVKFFPEEIERKIAGLLDARFYITSLPHESLGQQIVLKIEGLPWGEEKKSLFLRLMASCLTKYEIPKRILFVDRFEETASGKIKRLSEL
jgi:O-succinylbenzoic acid--CoA ligase